jgi:hypothetical protein
LNSVKSILSPHSCLTPDVIAHGSACAAAGEAGAAGTERAGKAHTPGRRRMLLGIAAGLATPFALSGCAGPTVSDYVNEKPALDLRRYFDGEVLAHGLFVDRSGKVVRRFTVTMACRWNGEEGELDERFQYSDGKAERRVWRLRHLGGGKYVGRADDVVGEALGESAGNSFRWAYTLRLPVDGRVWEVQFDDWMHLVDDRVMLNRAAMSKFGIHLGEVQLVFRRRAAQATAGHAPGQTPGLPATPPELRTAIESLAAQG